MQECPQPPPGPTSHAGRARTGAPTDRSRSLAISRAVRGSRPDQCVDHRPCLPVFFSWLHFRQPRRQQPHVAAHSSDHRIGSGLRPRDRRPFVGARHPLRPQFARSSSAGHRWSAARDTSWLTLITSSGRHIMRRSMRQAPSAASTRPPRITAARRAPKPTSRRSSHLQSGQDLPARRRTRDRADRDLQSICPGGAGFGTHNSWQPRNHALAALADSYRRPVPGPASGRFLTAHAKAAARYAGKRTTAAPYR